MPFAFWIAQGGRKIDFYTVGNGDPDAFEAVLTMFAPCPSQLGLLSLPDNRLKLCKSRFCGHLRDPELQTTHRTHRTKI